MQPKRDYTDIFGKVTIIFSLRIFSLQLFAFTAEIACLYATQQF